jgi:hypothetical protein
MPQFEASQNRLPDKFPQDRIVWNEIVVQGEKPIQECQQTFGLNIFRGAERDLAQ